MIVARDWCTIKFGREHLSLDNILACIGENLFGHCSLQLCSKSTYSGAVVWQICLMLHDGNFSVDRCISIEAVNGTASSGH